MIDGLTEEKAAAIPDAALYRYFCLYGRYQPDAPPATKYVIRVGVTFIYAADTMKLRMAFERHVGKLRTKAKVMKLTKKLRNSPRRYAALSSLRAVPPAPAKTWDGAEA